MLLNIPSYKLFGDVGGGGGGPGGPTPGPEIDAPLVKGFSEGQGFTTSLPSNELNDLLIVFIGGGEATQPGWTTAPSGWTLLQTLDGQDGNSALFWKFSNGSEPPALAFPPSVGTESNCRHAAISIQYANEVPFVNDPEIATVVEATASNTHALASNVVANTGELVVAFVHGGNGGVFPYTPPTGFTEFADGESAVSGNNGCIVSGAYLENVVAGTQTGLSFQTTAAMRYNSMIMTIRRGQIPPDPNALVFSMDETATGVSGNAVNFSMDETI